MLNHSSQPIQTKLSWDTFEIITTQDYEIGDQVFINYGRHSNSFLLLEYGFIGEFSKELDYVNLNDVCMNLLSTNKREECAKRGMKECVCQFESIGWIMKCVLMLVCSEENELSAWIDVWDGITDSISLENDIKWKELAMKILYEAIDSTEKKVKQVESLKDASDCTLMTSRCDMILKMLKYQLIITKSIKL